MNRTSPTQCLLIQPPGVAWRRDVDGSQRTLRLLSSPAFLLVVSADFDSSDRIHVRDFRRAEVDRPWSLADGRSHGRSWYQGYLRQSGLPVISDADLRWLDIGGAP